MEDHWLDRLHSFELRKFNGKSGDFQVWSDRVKKSFIGAQLKHILLPLRDKQSEETETEYSEYKACIESSAAAISLALESDDYYMAKHLNTPFEILECLKAHHHKTTKHTKMHYFYKLLNFKKKDPNDLDRHMTEYKALVRDAKAHGINDESFTVDEMMCLLFLRSLPKRHEIIVSIIEYEEKELEIDDIMRRVQLNYELSEFRRRRA